MRSTLIGLALSAAVVASPAMGQDRSLAGIVAASEQARFRAEFETALRPLRSALTSARGNDRLLLLLQLMRVQQSQRLLGRTAPDEAAVLAEVDALAATAPADLRALALLRKTTSDYAARLARDDVAGAKALAPAFLAAANGVADPCERANALFFAGLMQQVSGDVTGSAAPLATALSAAEANRCEMEISYVLRHQAAIAEDQGDLQAARDLYARSLAIRRQIGFEIFMPFSMLSLAEVEAKLGNRPAATKLREEALELAKRLDFPVAREAAQQALADR